MKFKLNKKTAILLILVLVILLVSAYGAWNTGWVVANDGFPVGVYVGSGQDCNKVTNNGAYNYFVPTKTTAEWNAFAANEPSSVVGVTADCCGGSGSDDAACGTIDCSGWYHEVGGDSAEGTNYCYNSPDITSSRCEGLDNCKDANSTDCGSANGVIVLSCSTCKYVFKCSGTVGPSCGNYAQGTYCGSQLICDGSGNCIPDST